MKKYWKILLVLFLISGTVLLALPFLRQDLSDFLKTEKHPEFVNELPHFTLSFSDSVQQHFDLLYQDYIESVNGEQSTEFLQTYEMNNSWQNAIIKHNGTTYKVQVKSHGRSPHNHFQNNRFSLGIKLLEGAKIRERTRFNLIIYSRISSNYDENKVIPKQLDLLMQDIELIRLSLNNSEPYLYFLETRMNNKWLRSKADSAKVILANNEQSPTIYTAGVDIHELETNLNTVLVEKNFSGEMKTQIRASYKGLNECITSKRSHDIETYFSLEYISSLMAARLLNGDDGHGFEVQNLIVAYDTITAQFYPIYHRDCFSALYSKSQSVEASFISNYTELPLFEVLQNNPEIWNLTKEKVQNYLNSPLADSALNQLVDAQKYHSEISFAESISSAVGGGLEEKHRKNFNQLRDWLNISP